MKKNTRQASVNCLKSSYSHARLTETQNFSASQVDLASNMTSAKKSKTPHRKRATTAININERTKAMADKLKKSVFKLAREDEQDDRFHPS